MTYAIVSRHRLLAVADDEPGWLPQEEQNHRYRGQRQELTRIR